MPSDREAVGHQKIPAERSPTELRVNAGRDRLTVAFEDGSRHMLTAEYLRVESPSAEVRGHGGAPKIAVTGKEHVKIARLEPVGNYAVRIIFDDGHDSGLYSWDLLAELGEKIGQKADRKK